ncbi:MAG: hypothetical protein HKN24_05560 [Acidimicrobiales bacterium]|nr:hypothetical protein [Acidimicrobiales bacterium]
MNGQQQQQGRNGNGSRANKRKRARNRKSKAKQNRAFWGDEGRLPEPPTRARITDDPVSVIRSLGRPPMPGFEQQAQHYFEAVTMRAVAIGAAIAAAGDMVDADEL